MRKTVTAILSLVLAGIIALNGTAALAMTLSSESNFWLPVVSQSSRTGFVPGELYIHNSPDAVIKTETVNGLEVKTLYSDSLEGYVTTDPADGLEVIAVCGDKVTINVVTFPAKSTVLLIGAARSQFNIFVKNGWVRSWIVYADANGLYGSLAALSEQIEGDVFWYNSRNELLQFTGTTM